MIFSSLPIWAKNVLQVYDFESPVNPYKYWYDFLKFRLSSIPGDIVEIGVYRGRTLCSTAWVASQDYIPRTVYGFDSFDGFPETNHPNDQPEKFVELFNLGFIDSDHFQSFQLNCELNKVVGRDLSTSGLSSSGNFSAPSQELVMRKLSYLGLTNYKLINGDIAETMVPKNLPNQISAIFLDADLYEPYRGTLQECWSRLSVGGIVFLDEYFSLKFPGPRIAVNEFLSLNSNAELKCIESPVKEFQRWVCVKVSE